MYLVSILLFNYFIYLGDVIIDSLNFVVNVYMVY